MRDCNAQLGLNFRSIDLNKHINIVRLGDSFSLKRCENDIKQLIMEIEDKYPNIEEWYDKKVINGLKDKGRFAYLIYYDSKPVATTIVRRSGISKLCSMRILPGYRSKGIGQLIVSLFAREIRNYSEKIYFTAPSSTYEEYEQFFNSFGFVNRGTASKQYRMWDEELYCEVDTRLLWNSVLNKLDDLTRKFTLIGNPKYPDLVISIKPQFAKKIVSGEKTVEVRKKFDLKWKGAYALLYSTEPHGEFIGEAKIDNVVRGRGEVIWGEYGKAIGVSKEIFDKYCAESDEINALVLSEISIYKGGILRRSIEKLLEKDVKAPQSHCQVDQNNYWPTAIALNYLLLA